MIAIGIAVAVTAGVAVVRLVWFGDDGDSGSDKICVALNVLNSLSTYQMMKRCVQA